ncbi:hypothetical protein EVAR_95241_1 [Eumeta japonica]|uniref:CCHC-type domain-containing protein n=1 Tax=Eumeta variegata TaxID=151549 RepID=A0A4C1UKQ4_EUMVA|nr:hypothetical protein EVAR_95241_1 [Eumeta japonica]
MELESEMYSQGNITIYLAIDTDSADSDSEEATCNVCGEMGHRGTECKAEFKRCATCHRFKKERCGQPHDKFVKLYAEQRHDSMIKGLHYLQHLLLAEATMVNFDSKVACAFISELSNNYSASMCEPRMRVYTWLATMISSSGTPATSLSAEQLWNIFYSFPYTSLGINGVTARII